MDKRPTSTVTARTGLSVRVRGLVQGVGYRPFVWRLANELQIAGDVLNDGGGVLIRAWGDAAALRRFVDGLSCEAPPLADIRSVEQSSIDDPPPGSGFDIVQSRSGAIETGIVPDAATCPACLADIRDPANRRYRYAFTNCTHCGPRLSIVRAIPYDRAKTSMAVFPMCAACQSEYDDPGDRRFHAQPNACEVCGPRLWLELPGEENAPDAPATDPVQSAVGRIRQGQIGAIKGIGGFHLACDATNEQAVSTLRRRKRRFDKPFALMARDPHMIARYARLSSDEEALLAGPAAPIVVLERDPTSEPVAGGIAPGVDSLGFMLPYTPLHHLLMAELAAPIVLTSGNRSDEPQCIDNVEARDRLSEIADFWLMHDRDIVNRLDDSVMRTGAGGACMLRRARGFAPAPIELPEGFNEAPPVLAMGGELKVTFCLLTGGSAVVSQHMGDLEDASVHGDYRKNLGLYRSLFAFDPKVVAVDRHPDYLSTQWGEALVASEDAELCIVQHHHAHIAGVMAEHGLPLNHGPILGVVLDGLGLGEDDTVWGGEFLIADYCDFGRAGHFLAAPLIGGTQAMREPWRNTYAFLKQCGLWERAASEHDTLPFVQALKAKPLATLDNMIERGINAPVGVSAGRLFDAAAAALGIRFERISYEGQAAIELEALAATAPEETHAYGYEIEGDRPAVIDWSPLWAGLLHDLTAGVVPARIAARFHNGVITATVALSERLARANGLEAVALSGGVFQNRLLLEGVHGALRERGFEVLIPRQTPVNDGGLSLGQAAVAAARAVA